MCLIGDLKEFVSGQQVVGQKNQSVLATFQISNSMLMEMRRLMASKCTAEIEGTQFDIFKLTKLINHMKSRQIMFKEKPKPLQIGSLGKD